jgi:hypothetical protein
MIIHGIRYSRDGRTACRLAFGFCAVEYPNEFVMLNSIKISAYSRHFHSKNLQNLSYIDLLVDILIYLVEF